MYQGMFAVSFLSLCVDLFDIWQQGYLINSYGFRLFLFGSSFRWQITGVTCLLGFVTSLVFVTNAGLIFLDTIDYCKCLEILLFGRFRTENILNVKLLTCLLFFFLPPLFRSVTGTDPACISRILCRWMGLRPRRPNQLLWYPTNFVAYVMELCTRRNRWHHMVRI